MPSTLRRCGAQPAPSRRPAVRGRPVEEDGRRGGVVEVGGGDQHGEHEAERAGQHMPLDALDPLVAVHAPLAALRPGHHALAVEDGRPGLCRMAAAAAHAPRQQGGRIRPDPIRAKPVVPAPHGLPGAELLRQKAPLAAGLLQVQTGVHHLPQIDHQGRVASEQRREQRPFRVRQITGVTPPVILVSLTLRRSPHRLAFRKRPNARQDPRSNRLSYQPQEVLTFAPPARRAAAKGAARRCGLLGKGQDFLSPV
jgi:hypothetical protein